MENEMIEILKNVDFSNNIWQIITPLIFSLTDIITGYIQSLINENTDSKKMRKGLLHKTLIIIIIVMSYIVSFAFNIEYISKGVILYVIVMEFTSIIENLKKAGINLGKLGSIVKEKTDNSVEESLDKLTNTLEDIQYKDTDSIKDNKED